jgi:PAS domain S-box-containing protein
MARARTGEDEGSGGGTAQPRKRVADFVRGEQPKIIAEWLQCIGRLPTARALDRPALIDHVPQLLTGIADLIEELGEGGKPTQLACDRVERHAISRLHEGFDLAVVIREIAALRECLVRLWRATGDGDPTGVDVLHQALDEAIADSADQYVGARSAAAAREAAQLEAVIESIPDAVIIGTAERIVRCNTAALELLGWRRDELDRPLERLTSEIPARDPETGEGIAPGDRPFARALSGDVVRREMIVHHRKSGSDLVVRSTAAPVRVGGEIVGAVAVNSDVTAERRAADEHRRARAESERALAILDALLTSSLVGLGFLDSELRYLRVNDALATMNDLPAAEHVGRMPREVIGEIADSIEPRLREVLRTGTAISNLELSATLPGRTGPPRTFLASYFPVRLQSGETVGIGAAVVEITERKRAEEALRFSEARLQSILDNAPAAILIKDEESRCVLANAMKCALLGRSLGEVLGRRDHELLPPEVADEHVANDRQMLASEMPTKVEEPIPQPDGMHTFLTVRFPVPGPDGRTFVGAISTDISERKRAEAAQAFLSEAAAVLAQSLDHQATLARVARLAVPRMADWCVVDLLDRTGATQRVALEHADPAKVAYAVDLTKRYPPDRSASGGVGQVIASGEPIFVREVTPETLRRVARDEEHHEILRKLGFRSYIIAPLIARGRVLGAISLVTSESARTYDQRDLDLALELAARAAMAVDNALLYEEAQRSARLRERVLAVVSHDLRNPLNVVRMAAMLLRDRTTEEGARRQLDMMLRSTSRMELLIRDLLDVASIQAGRIAIEPRAVPVASLLANALEAHRGPAAEKGIALDVTSYADVDAVVRCDPERTQQVFANLLGNALKFTEPGGAITLDARRGGDEIALSVADTGAGIAADELAHVFDPYWSARHHAKQGTGLGLYIARGIVEAMGGRIGVESEVGAGTKFWLTLPLVR